MAALVDLGANDTLSLQADSLSLHAFHRQFAGVIKGLRIVDHLDVLSHLPHPLPYSLLGNVIDAAAHDHTDGAVPGLEQGPEILAGEVRGERHAVCIAKGLTTA